MMASTRSAHSLIHPGRTLIAALALLAFMFLDSARAQIPESVAYQGLLRDAGGAPLTTTVRMEFRLYTTLLGGTPIWQETHESVPVDNGIFSVDLGVDVPLALPFDRAYFLGVRVAGDDEMTPRHQLLAVPYALRARDVDNDADTLAGLGCTPGQMARRGPDDWACAEDLGATLAGQLCPEGEVMRGVDADGSIVCAASSGGTTDPPAAGTPCAQPGCASEINAGCASLPTLREQMLCAHNVLRDGVDPPAAAAVPHLAWDPLLAQVAQSYAAGCTFVHNANRTSEYAGLGGSGSVGENLAAGTSLSPLAGAVLWAEEAADYNMEPVSEGSTAVVGHYTQMVWANTTHVGCGVGSCPGGITGTSFGGDLLVCNYAPAGNFLGQLPYQPSLP